MRLGILSAKQRNLWRQPCGDGFGIGKGRKANWGRKRQGMEGREYGVEKELYSF